MHEATTASNFRSHASYHLSGLDLQHMASSRLAPRFQNFFANHASTLSSSSFGRSYGTQCPASISSAIVKSGINGAASGASFAVQTSSLDEPTYSVGTLMT